MSKGERGSTLFIVIYHCMYHNESYHDVLVH